HVLRGKHALVPATAHVHYLVSAAEMVYGLRDKALAPGAARAFDFLLPSAAARRRLLQNALVGFRMPDVGKERIGEGELATWKVNCSRCRPMLAEQPFDGCYRRAAALDQRIAFARISNRRL